MSDTVKLTDLREAQRARRFKAAMDYAGTINRQGDLILRAWGDGIEIELLPCPFCGGEADHHDIGNAHTKSRATKIWCTCCHYSHTTKAIRQGHDWTRSRAIAGWNHRTPDAGRSALAEDGRT